MNWITRYFSPPNQVLDEFALFKVRLLGLFLFITAAVNIVYIIIFTTLLHSNISISVFIFGALSYSVLLLLMRLGVNLNLISQCMLVIGYCGVIGAAYFSGGANSFVLPWLSLIPVLSVLLLDYKKTVIWFLMVMVTFLILGLADPWLPPMRYTKDPWRAMFAVTGLSLLLFYFTSLFDRGRYKILGILKEKNDQLEKNQQTINTNNAELLKQKLVIEEYNKTLEDRVHARTLDLEMKNKQLAEYAFINSHLLRGPLSNILGLVNILQKTELTKKEEEIVTHLKDASVQLDDIISKINKAIDENAPLDRSTLNDRK